MSKPELNSSHSNNSDKNTENYLKDCLNKIDLQKEFKKFYLYQLCSNITDYEYKKELYEIADNYNIDEALKRAKDYIIYVEGIFPFIGNFEYNNIDSPLFIEDKNKENN